MHLPAAARAPSSLPTGSALAPRVVLVLLVLLVVLATAAAGSARAAGDPSEPAPLPESLPPLDESLVKEAPASPMSLFAAVRLRGELDDSRDLSRVDDASAGAALSGLVGASAALEGAHVDVVVGDGARIGQPPTAPALVARPALPALEQAQLSFDLSVAGFPAALSLGRMPVVVADGRWVGTEPFDPRGRTLDGARLRAHAGLVDAGLGAFWLGPGDLDAADTGRAVSALGVLEAGVRAGDDVDLDVYALLHRDGPAGLTLPTLGLRASGSWSFLRGRAGADAQAPLADGSSAFSPAGTAGHAEAGVRATAPLARWFAPPGDEPAPSASLPDVYVDGSGEITAGTVVDGRVFRAPAPTQHDVLGLLDFVAADNTWSAAVAAGADDGAGRLEVAGRIIGIVDGAGPLLDTGFKPIPQRRGDGIALFELDATLALPLTKDLALGVGYAVAVPGAALVGDEPAQRLFVSLSGAAGDAASPLPAL